MQMYLCAGALGVLQGLALSLVILSEYLIRHSYYMLGIDGGVHSTSRHIHDYHAYVECRAL
jgi:hypothetical protein